MARRRRSPAKEYRLSFTTTRTKKWAPTLKQAVADARYWTSWGAGKVCIDRKMPSGSFKRVRCLVRKR